MLEIHGNEYCVTFRQGKWEKDYRILEAKFHTEPRYKDLYPYQGEEVPMRTQITLEVYEIPDSTDPEITDEGTWLH